jgi:hypothetical protein
MSKAWQRQRYVRAPGMFVRMLERKAATGGELIEFGKRATRVCPSSATLMGRTRKNR